MAFSVVRYESQFGPKDGVATTWLERVLEPVTSGRRAAARSGVRLPIFLRRCGRRLRLGPGRAAAAGGRAEEKERLPRGMHICRLGTAPAARQHAVLAHFFN